MLHRPDKITGDEIDAIKLRRKIEKQIILDIELNGDDKGDRSSSHHWYIISSDWLYKWKCFVTNKISKAVNPNILDEINQSINDRIGILPPGPISNYTLFENDGIIADKTLFGINVSRNSHLSNVNTPQAEIREDLVVELDYKTIKKEVWKKFMNIYGGGPPIIREKPYIYGPIVIL